MKQLPQFIFITFLNILLFDCAKEPTYNGYTIKELKGGGWEDDSTYIYELPFEKGKKIFLAQAYDSRFSHKNELSLDFKIKPGTKICAGRGGLVVSVKEDSNQGGLKEKYLSHGNHVVIQHDDGTFGGYWHLEYEGAYVEEGEIVKKGHLIGSSGNTGYSAFPHLHFWVYKYEDGKKITIPTRFNTTSGVRYLKPARSYTRPL